MRLSYTILSRKWTAGLFYGIFEVIMRILAIETSCDETSIAILDCAGGVVTPVVHIIRSQVDIHAAFGGVVPEVAAREHLAHLLKMIREHVDPRGEGIDAIAVTVGPGLAPALRVGIDVAKTLAVEWNKPFVPVCHLEGHIYANWITKTSDLKFPVLALIVSGGHTELVLMKGHGEFERLGETIDDAAGEAFDKVAKMLGLQYPGGPEVEKLAVGGNVAAFAFPRAMTDRDGFDFSFAGLKTAVLYFLRENESHMHNEKFRRDVAASFQEAVVDVLIKKTTKAIAKYAPLSLVLAGGVAANSVLRERFAALGLEHNVDVHVPDFAYSLDNAAMIGCAGYYRFLRGGVAVDVFAVKAEPNLDIV